MKKLIFILPFILFSCSKSVETKMEVFEDSMVVESSLSDSLTVLNKAEAALQHTEGLEYQIKETYKSKETLLKENKQLKAEIKSIKDSLVEVKKRLPKKKNFLQKVFNIKPDTIEVITIDTIK
jgi:peptidoglycan hydrolase CwlO-like protein